jgi:2-dehydro-3-deoxygalactonokinase
MIGRWDHAAGRPLRHDRQPAGLGEAPYARCPAGADDIVQALARIEHAAATISLVPGLSTENDAHARRDARRGDADSRRARAVRQRRGLFLLPGTHSKWAQVQAAASCRSAPS